MLIGACRGTLLEGLGSLFGGVGVTFWSGWGQFLMIFGMSWDVSGSGLGTFLDGFGAVWEKNPARSENQDFDK